MELQLYRFTVEYHPDASNLADHDASRHPVGDLESHNFEVESEEHISFIARNSVRKAATPEVESAPAKGPVLQAVISVMKSGCWHKAPCGISLSELSRFEKVASQGAITCTDKVLLKSDRLVVSALLQERIVDIAHEVHLGIVNAKALL